MMRVLTGQLKQLCTGARVSRVFLYLLAPAFLAGYTSGITHSYDHLADQQPELICQLCIAGDKFTHLPASVVTARPAHPHIVCASVHGAWPILITRHSPGTPRDPPTTV